MTDNKKNIAESRDSVPAADIQQAISLCRELTNEHGRQLLEVMFEVGAEKLLELSSNPKSDDVKSFSGIARDIGSSTPKVLDNYSRIFLATFDDQGGAEPAPKAGFSQGLSLVDEEALQQEILVNRMSAVAAAETQSQFSKLNRRFCFLLDRRIMPVDSPLSPKSQAECMTGAVEVLDIPEEATLVLLNCLEQEFANALGYLYSEINESLIDLGILPDIKHHVWRAEVSTRVRSKASLTESQRKALDELHRPEDTELKEMLVEVSKKVGPEEGAEVQPVEAVDFRRDAERVSQLLHQLSQSSVSEGDSLVDRLDAAADAASEPRTAGAAREIITQADEIASRFSKPFARRGNTREAYLAKKLAVPFARLSVEDPSIVVDEKHVLRQALSELGAYADCIEVVDEKVRSGIVEEFEELTEGFELLDFEDPAMIANYAADITNRSAVMKLDLKEQLRRLTKFQEGRTELEAAQRNIDLLLQKALVGNRFPSATVDFLLGKWRSILVHCFLGAEKHAPGWQAARSATDKLVTLIPELEKGIPTARQSDFNELIKNIWNQLVKYASYRGSPSDLLIELGLHGGSPFGDLSDEEQASLAPLLGQIESSWREVVTDDPAFLAHQLTDNNDLPAKAEKAYQLWKDRLKPGTWVELKESEDPIRCRLLKVFGDGSRCVFVDGLGRLTRSFTALEVLERVKQGKLKKAA